MIRKYNKIYSKDKYVTNFLCLLGREPVFVTTKLHTGRNLVSIMEQLKPVRQISWDFKSF